MSYTVEPVNWDDIVTMIRRIPVFQQGAVCLTKFGPELGETANEFWWGISEKGIAQSINNLISQYNATSVLFSAIKNEEPPKNGSSQKAWQHPHWHASESLRFRFCRRLLGERQTDGCLGPIG